MNKPPLNLDKVVKLIQESKVFTFQHTITIINYLRKHGKCSQYEMILRLRIPPESFRFAVKKLRAADIVTNTKKNGHKAIELNDAKLFQMLRKLNYREL